MEQVPDAASSLLDFASVKRRAISSRCYRVKIPTSNGTTFTAGQTMNLDLGGNIFSSYYDFSQSYILATVDNTAVAAAGVNDGALCGRSGAYCLIDRFQVITGGQTISDIQQFNVLASTLISQNTGYSWGNSVGANMIGTGTAGTPHLGANIAEASGGPLRVALPFICTSLANTTPARYVCAFGRDSIRMRVYLSSNLTAFVSAGAPLMRLTEVEAVMYIVELSSDAQALVNAMCGGVYNILCSDYRTVNGSFTGNVGGGGLTTTQTLGFAVSSLERIIVVHRRDDALTQPNQAMSRSLATLNEYQCFINGAAFPERPIVLDGVANTLGYGAEGFAETMVAQHALSDFGHGSQLNMVGGGLPSTTGLWAIDDGDGSSSANTGQGVVAIELESLAGKSNELYSGISTIGAVVQYRGVYNNPAAGVVYNISFFAQFTSMLSLDMNNLGTFVVSV
tara:strand:- start:677 stop:2032 length:1356 start_codon:yes stop_codon:yes gene_type:complete